jgi:hypothetical protein
LRREADAAVVDTDGDRRASRDVRGERVGRDRVTRRDYSDGRDRDAQQVLLHVFSFG